MSAIGQAIQTIRRGADELIVEEELAKKLASGRKLRIKLGLADQLVSTPTDGLNGLPGGGHSR